MEGAAAEPGLFRCMLCAWEAPSRLAVLHHLRAPAHRDAQAQRRLQLLQNGPAAAEDGLSSLHSILSFSHGQLPTPGEQVLGTGGQSRESGRWGQEGQEGALRLVQPQPRKKSSGAWETVGVPVVRRVENGSELSAGQEQEGG